MIRTFNRLDGDHFSNLVDDLALNGIATRKLYYEVFSGDHFILSKQKRRPYIIGSQLLCGSLFRYWTFLKINRPVARMLP